MPQRAYDEHAPVTGHGGARFRLPPWCAYTYASPRRLAIDYDAHVRRPLSRGAEIVADLIRMEPKPVGWRTRALP